MHKINMWTSGFCTYACIHSIANLDNIPLAIFNAVFAITNLIIGWGD